MFAPLILVNWLPSAIADQADEQSAARHSVDHFTLNANVAVTSPAVRNLFMKEDVQTFAGFNLLIHFRRDPGSHQTVTPYTLTSSQVSASFPTLSCN